MMDTWDICLVSVRGDAQTAERLAESIKNYRLPSGITPPQGSADYRKILLDTQEAPFDEQVQRQLDNSRFLIFLCSPAAKDNAALNQRLAAFLRTHDRDRTIAVLVKGEPDEAFPENLRERKMVKHILPDQRVIERIELIEPIAADLRGDTEKRKKQMLRYETVRIVASVMSLHPDDLEQRQQARQKRALIRILCLAAAVVLVISGIFIRLGIIARKEGRIADQQTQLSVNTAERTIKELPELFADEPLALGYIKEAIQNAREALAELGLEELLDDAESGETP
ncbi:MAG: hypothetical protein J5865_04055 [Lachnospiraceae bacterium]|nr:hypothetical protein [Lachnospiraceae bacterium]